MSAAHYMGSVLQPVLLSGGRDINEIQIEDMWQIPEPVTGS